MAEPGLFDCLPATRKRTPTYAEYLRSSVWQEKRAAALERDGHACRCCPSTEQLEVHHRRYPEVLGEEPLEDLTTLCRGCHAIIS